MAIEAARLMVAITADTREAQAEIQSAGDKLKSWGANMSKVGNTLTTKITTPLMQFGKQALSVGVDYDRAMGMLRQSTGATGDEMKKLDKLAHDLGSDLTLPGTSAGDAAEAMVELGKAGLELNDIMNASRGVLEMSAAGQISNAAAAEITANALNSFSLAGSEANRVADLFAAGANASSAEVLDMAEAFNMSSAVFSAAGFSIENLTTMIAQMSNAGIKGSDAGTSLKQMLLSLQTPSTKASEVLKEYNIDVYDMNHNMVSAESLVSQFSEKLGGLSQEQRNTALATIFGSDAVRAANIVLMGGVDAYNDMEEAVTESGAAQDMAAAQTNGLAGASDSLKSSIETLMLEAISLYHDDLVSVMDAMAGAVNSFNEMDDGTKKLILGVVGIAAAIGPTLSVAGSFTTSLTAVAAALGVSAASLGIVAAGAVVAVGAIAALNQWGFKPQQEMLENSQDAMESYYSTMIEGGADIAEVLDYHTKSQNNFNKQVEESGVVLTRHYAKQKLEELSLRELGKALILATGTQEEYEAAMKEAAETAGYSVNAQGDLTEKMRVHGSIINVVVEKNWLLTESEREAAQAATELQKSAETMEDSWVKSFNPLHKGVSDIQNVDDAQKNLAGSVDLVKEAYDMGLMSFEDYQTYLEAARQGTLDLTEAEQANFETEIQDAQYKRDIADAAREMAEAIGDAKVEQLDLSESFKGATEADYAREMIKNLKEEIAQTGDPTGELTATVEALGLQYGVMTESSIRASEAWPALDAAMKAHIITGDDAVRAMSLFDTQVESGKWKIEELFQALGIAPEVYQPLIEAAKQAEDSMGGTTNATNDWHSAMNNIDTDMQGLSGEKMEGVSTSIQNVGQVMATAATEEGGFVQFSQVLKDITTNMGTLNNDLGKMPGLLETFSGDEAANAITGMQNIGDAMKNVSSGEGGVNLMADGMESITDSLAVLSDNKTVEGVSDNVTNLGTTLAEMSAEGTGISLFSNILKTIGDSMVTIAEKSVAIQQSIPGLGEIMQQTAEQNLTPFGEKTTDIVEDGLSPIHSLLDTITKIDLPKFNEALKITLNKYLKPFEDKIINLVNVTIPGLIKSFEDFIEIVETSRLKVIDLHNAIDALPSHKTITIDVLINHPGSNEGGGDEGQNVQLQAGGPAFRNQPYIVGEKGPELFIPAENGRVLSNRQSREAIANMNNQADDELVGGGNIYNIQVTSLGDADSIGDSVLRSIQRLELLYG